MTEPSYERITCDEVRVGDLIARTRTEVFTQVTAIDEAERDPAPTPVVEREQGCERCHDEGGWTEAHGQWYACPDCNPAPSQGERNDLAAEVDLAVENLRVALTHPTPDPTERDIALNLSYYESGVLKGALIEFAEKWADDAHTARDLLDRVTDQLPEAWENE